MILGIQANIWASLLKMDYALSVMPGIWKGFASISQHQCRSVLVHVQDRSSCVFLNLAWATQQALLAGSDLEANSVGSTAMHFGTATANSGQYI